MLVYYIQYSNLFFKLKTTQRFLQPIHYNKLKFILLAFKKKKKFKKKKNLLALYFLFTYTYTKLEIKKKRKLKRFFIKSLQHAIY